MNLTHVPAVRRKQAPQAQAIADDVSGPLSNTEFALRIEEYARHFIHLGVERGDIVAVKLSNRAELVVALFAAWRVGAALTPVNPALTVEETAYQIQDSHAKLVVFETHSERLPATVTTVHMSELAGPAPRVGLPDLPADLNAGLDDLALVIYTSGTTGRPKGVELLHRNLDAMTGALVDAMQLTEHDHSLLVLPLFHVNGIVVSVLSPLRAGGQATIMGRFRPTNFFNVVERVRPTFFSGVPAIYAMLANLPPEVRPDTSSLRFVVCGAAPMPPQLIPVVERRFGVRLVEGYGLSEATCASTTNPLDGIRKPGTVGLALPNQTVAVMDARGRLITDGSPGEVVITGPTVMRGYLGRPEETSKVLRDGWLHTGDIGRIDEDGYLTLVDRAKDMIIRGGENIYPKEIETVLHDHPAVLEAAVVGRPDPVMGEIPAAFVSLRAGTGPLPEDLPAFLEARLAVYKRPADIRVLPEIPKNAVGKPDKPALRRLLAPTRS